MTTPVGTSDQQPEPLSNHNKQPGLTCSKVLAVSLVITGSLLIGAGFTVTLVLGTPLFLCIALLGAVVLCVGIIKTILPLKKKLPSLPSSIKPSRIPTLDLEISLYENTEIPVFDRENVDKFIQKYFKSIKSTDSQKTSFKYKNLICHRTSGSQEVYPDKSIKNCFSAVFNSLDDAVSGAPEISDSLYKNASDHCWNSSKPFFYDEKGNKQYREMRPGDIGMALWEGSDTYYASHDPNEPDWTLLAQLKAAPSSEYTPEKAFPIFVNAYLKALVTTWDHKRNPWGKNCQYWQTPLIGTGKYAPSEPQKRATWLCMAEMAFWAALKQFAETPAKDLPQKFPSGTIRLMN